VRLSPALFSPHRIPLIKLVLGVWLTQPLSATAAQGPSDAIAARPKVARDYGALPLSFERNLGQADREARYVAQGAGYSILLDEREAVLLLSRPYGGRGDLLHIAENHSPRPRASVSPADALRMQLIGMNPGAVISGENQLPGTANYFTGNDRTKWLTGVPTFARVKYADVYPGVDLTYYGNRQRLEFDYEVSPGADANLIRMRFDGARRLRLDKAGDLIIASAHGQVSFQKPVIYQPAGEDGRQSIEGSFRIVSRRTVAFIVGRYDHAKLLVIDPIFDYSTYLGPSVAYAIAVDAAGEAYVAGGANTGMPTTGGIQPNPVAKQQFSDASVFVAKINGAGTGLIYCTYLSGNNDDEAYALALDPAGNAYVAGDTQSTDFPVTPGAYQTTYKTTNGSEFGPTNFSGFVAAINSTGTSLLYSTYLSGSTQTSITGISVDSAGEAYVTGLTYDADFPTTTGAFQTSPTGNVAQEPTGFVTKLNATGSTLAYSTYLGGSAGDFPNAIALDANDKAYIVGNTNSFDFPTTPGAFQPANMSGDGSAFVTKLNSDGSALVYSTYLGGNLGFYIALGEAINAAEAVAVDSSGDAYVTGYAISTNFPVTPGVFQPFLNLGTAVGSQNAFTTKFNSSGTGLVYSTYLGGNSSFGGLGGADTATGIAVDSSGNAYVTGGTLDIDFPVTPGAYEQQNLAMSNSGDGASFVTKINSTASQILYSTYLSGSGDQTGETCDCAKGIALDPSGNAYVAGFAVSPDFPSTLGAFEPAGARVVQTPTGPEVQSYSTFVTKFNASEMTSLPATTTTVTSNVTGQEYGQPVTFTATVIPSSGSAPTGTVGFSVLSPSVLALGRAMGPWTTVAVNGSGAATYTTDSLITGQIPVTAYYLGDENNAPSNGTMTEIVSPIPTTTTVTSTANPTAYGSPITFTATVVETATGNPAKGYVTFDMGALSYAQVNLDSAGQATWANGTGGPDLPAGSDTITVSFIPAEPALVDQESSGSILETITAAGTVPPPTFSPPAGSYSSAQQVILNDADSGVTFYYATDGTAPIAGTSNFYSTGAPPIQVNASETIEAIATLPGGQASPVASAVYVINLPQPDFTFSLNSTSLTVDSGGTATTTVSVTAVDGFTGSVSFACTGLPASSSCNFSPSAVTPGVSSTLTIGASSTPSSHLVAITFAPIASLAFIVGWLGLWRKHLAWNLPFAVLLAFGLFSICACGSGGGGSSGGRGQNPPPIQTTSTVTITASSGSLSHTAILTLTVN
jgi:hypothetical protein